MNKKKSLSKRILSIFRDNPKTEYNSKTIDRFLYKKLKYDGRKRKKNIKQVRKELDRHVERGNLIKSDKGFYCLRISTKTLHLLDDPPVVAHGIKIEAKITSIAGPQNLILGITSHDPKLMTESWLTVNGFSMTTNKRWVKRFFWEGRFITLTIHPSCGLIEIWIKCSELPLGFTDMYRFSEYMRGFLSPVSDFKEVRVVEIGINKDFRELRLDGVSSMSLHVFLNAWSKIYNHKERGVRVETHWVGSIDLETVIELISKVNAPVVKEKVEKKTKWDDGLMFG